MKRWVGDASRVKRVPIRTVSVENAGWSAEELLIPSSIHDCSATPEAMARVTYMKSRRNMVIFYDSER